MTSEADHSFAKARLTVKSYQNFDTTGQDSAQIKGSHSMLDAVG